MGTKKEYKYNINDIITTNSGKIKILEQIKIPDGKDIVKGYKYECLIDGNIDQIREYSLIRSNCGCNVCSNMKVLKGCNDLWTTHPHIAKLLKNREDGYEVSYGSQKSKIFVCQNCGWEKPYKIKNIVNGNFSCDKCGDGISYPSKFIRAFLDQINEEYISEYNPKWAFIKEDNYNSKLKGKKKYDIYLPNKYEVWEIHGIQHYEDVKKRFGTKSKNLEDEQTNDKIKMDLAKENFLKYIAIDARYSQMEYIKNSLINLPETQRYNLTNIDWLKCHEYACNSLVKVVCDLWSNGIKNTERISNVMKLSLNTVVKYLKQGGELGWCDYNVQTALENRKKNSLEQMLICIKAKRRKIIQLTPDNEFIKEWDSIEKAKNVLGLNNIVGCCKNKYGCRTSGGFKWMYKEDYENNIKESGLLHDSISG